MIIMEQAKSLSQRVRLIILLVYVAGLIGASVFVFGTVLPPTTEKGVWFYSALAALLLGNLIVTPFFTKPADAISYSVAALVALLAVNVWGSGLTGFDRFVWTVALIHVVAVLVGGIGAIVLKDSIAARWRQLAESFRVLCDFLGSPRALFSSVFLFALIVFHRAEAREYVTIGASWALFVGLRPLEGLAALIGRWQGIWRQKTKGERIGSIVGHETPGILLIRQDDNSTAGAGTLLLARDEHGDPRIAVALDHVGFAEGRWLRALHIADPASCPSGPTMTKTLSVNLAGGDVFRVDGAEFRSGNNAIWDQRDRLVGLVAPETTVRLLHVEVTRTDLDLRQGALLETRINDRRVLYQIIDGVTREEIIQQKNTRGFVRAHAKKVGAWNAECRAFEPTPWLPQPNCPVFLAGGETCAAESAAVGHVPGTCYPVQLDPNLLVTHNAAILGILGVGKSFLAIELIERMIQAGIKVVCLDLTDQYAKELAPCYDANAASTELTELEKVGPAGKTNVKKNVEEGGSINEFSAKVREQLASFLDPANARKLTILNPVRFEVWRQDSKPFQNEASMATLTPTEITRIISEKTLEVLQAQGMADKARCCLVFEEAHSLIPEWNAVASEGDKTATNGTAKAILQGRKFGLGCLVITQRTANVTKSILNQCNTVFALRVFDATGMDFLKNYIGEDYAGVLSTLEDRHAVVFGRASSCRDPLLIRLNDRDAFLRVFRGPPRDATNTATPTEGAA